jgi:hypothetical protein
MISINYPELESINYVPRGGATQWTPMHGPSLLGASRKTTKTRSFIIEKIRLVCSKEPF